MARTTILTLLILPMIKIGTPFCYENMLSFTVYVNVLDSRFEESVSPQQKKCCHYSNCGGSRDKPLLMLVDLKNGAFHAIRFQAGGCLYTHKVDLDWGWPQTSFPKGIAEIYQTVALEINYEKDGICTGNIFSQIPYVNMEKYRRSVHFLATADPQYYMDSYPYESKEIPDRTIATMKSFFRNEENYRGIIVAGDLVQRADWRNQLFSQYEAAFIGFTNYLFDGFGNHDIDPANSYELIIREMHKTILCRKRIQVLNKIHLYSAQPDYSWNWDDVHFVQMNEYPGKPNGRLEWLKHGSD